MQQGSSVFEMHFSKQLTCSVICESHYNWTMVVVSVVCLFSVCPMSDLKDQAR